MSAPALNVPQSARSGGRTNYEMWSWVFMRVSGIVLVGAISQLGADSWAIRIIAAIAVLIASINVFGGFTVTNRMLKLFRKA